MAASDVDDYDLCSVAESDDAFSFCDIEFPVVSQTPKCRILNLRLTPPILRLPRELRDIIYRYALIEPPRSHKLHAISCAWNPNPEGLDTPLPHSVLMRHEFTEYELKCSRKAPCHCARRTSLSLRRTCRQIYAESTPIFYENNVFSFDDPEVLSKWIRRLTPRQRSLVHNLAVLRTRSRGGTVPPYRDIELLTGLRTLDIDAWFTGKDFGGRRAAQKRLAQLTQLRRVRIIRPGVFRFTVYGPRVTRVPVWEVCNLDFSDGGSGNNDDHWWSTEYDRHRLLPEDRAGLTEETEDLLTFDLPRPTDVSGWARPLRVPLFDRDDFDELLCFSLPLAESVVEDLRRKDRRATMRADTVERKSLRDAHIAEIKAKARAARPEKLDQLAERQEQRRKDDVVRLQPHKKWHAEARSRRAGIAKRKGRSAILQFEDEVEWAREDWDACARDDWD